jgi:hypothetical protein
VLGCNAHVSLSIPPPSAPLAEREAAYLELRPVRINQTFMYGPNGATSFGQELALANGSKVYYPEDILTVVPRTSKTAELVELSRSLNATGTACKLSVYAVGVAFAFLALKRIASGPSGLNTAGLVLTGSGAIGLAISGHFFASSAHDRAVEAYEHYDDDLQDALSICSGQRCRAPVVRDASEARVPAPQPGANRSKH